MLLQPHSEANHRIAKRILYPSKSKHKMERANTSDIQRIIEAHLPLTPPL